MLQCIMEGEDILITNEFEEYLGTAYFCELLQNILKNGNNNS